MNRKIWFLDTRDILEGNYFIPYEISNFSKRGYRYQHNLNYWKIRPYIGYGPQHTVMMELKDGKI